jgi:murein DD-endopeptidase MepM/ murein hydrolase activator NlpD
VSENIFTKILASICLVLVVLLAFEIGVWSYKNYSGQEVVQSSEAELEQLNLLIAAKERELANLELQNENYKQKEQELLGTINELRARVAGLSTSEQEPVGIKYPFAVPSSGVVGSQNGTFGGDMYGMKHLGIDIWTTTANGGRIASHSGNEVKAACTGKVVNITPENGGLTILCDVIGQEFDVPKREKVYTHYAHLGHAETKELYISVSKNQRVNKGDLIGYQGDLSSFFPEMRNVHLHFSVFTGLSEAEGALNPCLYIGGNCKVKGEIFTAI